MIDVWPVGELLVVSEPSTLSSLFATDSGVLRAGAATERVIIGRDAATVWT